MALPEQRVWTRWPVEMSSNLSHSVVLWLEMASFPSKVFKISLSEIMLLRGLHVAAGEGSGVWSLSVKAVIVQKHSALCAKQEGPFSLCVSASVRDVSVVP